MDTFEATFDALASDLADLEEAVPTERHDSAAGHLANLRTAALTLVAAGHPAAASGLADVAADLVAEVAEYA